MSELVGNPNCWFSHALAHVTVYCWHYVPMCPADSYYNGSLAVTNSGRLCQRWVDKTPHDHSWDYGTHHRYDEDYYYDTYHYFEVDGTVEAAENFCRNIGFDFVWCLTTDPGARDEYCDVRLCTGWLRNIASHTQLFSK